jgi:hypothetical protein
MSDYELGDLPADDEAYEGDMESVATDIWSDLTEVTNLIWMTHDVEHGATRMFCDNALCTLARNTSNSWAG